MTRFLLRRALPAAVVISLFGVLSRVLGVIRDRLLTATFGAGIETDAFLAANRIPDLLYQLLVVGAVSSVFIPAYLATKRDSPDDANRLAANVLGFITVFLGATSLLAFLFARPLVGLLGHGFSPAHAEMTVELMRIQLLSPILLGMSSVCSALLQTRRVFWTFAVAPVLYNVGQIAGIAWLARTMGIHGVAWGVVIGASLHLAVQLPSFLRAQPRLLPHALHRDAALRRMLRQALPRIFALAGLHVSLVVETAFASLLAVGSITHLAYGQNLMSVPLGIFGLPIAVAAFPLLASAAAASDQSSYRATLQRAVRQNLFWILPASLGLILLREEIIGALFQTQRFTAHDVRVTAGVLAFYSISLVTQALIPLYARAFYAQHDTRRPVIATFVTIALNLLCSAIFILVLGWGVWSLALSYTIATTVGFVLHAVQIRRYAGQGWAAPLMRPLGRMGLSLAVMALLVTLSLELLPWEGQIPRLVIGTAVGGASYLGLMIALGGEEWAEVRRRFRTPAAPLS